MLALLWNQMWSSPLVGSDVMSCCTQQMLNGCGTATFGKPLSISTIFYSQLSLAQVAIITAFTS